jgi:tetratricopeptide (TPR) repeat protein
MLGTILGHVRILDQKDKAMDEFKICIETDPEYIFAHNHLAVLYMDKENWDAAKMELDAGLSLCTEDPHHLWDSFRLLLARQNQFDNALDAIQQALDICPNHLPTFLISRYLLSNARISESKDICLPGT